MITLGWNETLAMPALGLSALRVKVDTGARSSSLHAFYIERFERDGREWVRFGVHPDHDSNERELVCEAQVTDWREVSDSGGHVERRPVIRTELVIGDQRFDAELNLTDRDSMRFRMLLGRTAMNGRYVVDPSRHGLVGMPVLEKHS